MFPACSTSGCPSLPVLLPLPALSQQLSLFTLPPPPSLIGPPTPSQYREPSFAPHNSHLTLYPSSGNYHEMLTVLALSWSPRTGMCCVCLSLCLCRSPHPLPPLPPVSLQRSPTTCLQGRGRRLLSVPSNWVSRWLTGMLSSVRRRLK